MRKGWRRWLVLATLVSSGVAVGSPPLLPERGARLWLLTSARLLEVDVETGDVLSETPVARGERLVGRGEASPPLVVAADEVRALTPRGRLAAEAIRDLPFAGPVLAARQGRGTAPLLLALGEGLASYTPEDGIEQRLRFPVVAEVATFGGDALWVIGGGRGHSFDLDALSEPAVGFDVPWSGSRAACYDELAGRLVVAEPQGIHWLDRQGREVAVTPLRDVEQLACGRFGSVWASGREGTALLRSLGDAGDVESALPPEEPATEPHLLAADPRDFGAFLAAGSELSRWTRHGERAWTLELGRGEDVRGMVTSSRAPLPATPRVEPAPERVAHQASIGPKVLGNELAVRGRLALNESKPTPAPSGSGQPVASGQITTYGASVVGATSATDGTFTTAAFPHTSGDSVVVYARKQTAQGRLMASATTAPAAGQTVDVGDLWLNWDCAMAFQSGLFPANALNGEVRAITFFDDGSGPALFVGGTFTTAGGVTVNRVAKWNGSTWSALGSGFTITSGTPSVDALVVFNDGSGARLYAAGLFNRSGAATVTNVAKWTGTSWAQVGTTAPGGQVLALAVHSSQLYAGGAFTAVGATTVNRIARWSGTAWVAVGTGFNNTVRALASHNDGTSTLLYAGGTFTTAGGSSAARMAKWNGSAWSALGSGVSGGTTIQVNALSSGELGGAPALHVGGRFTTAGSVTANHVAAWQGSTWKALGTGLNVEVGALGSFDDGAGARLYAAGSFTTVGSTSFNRLGRFTGTKWEPVGSGLNGNALALGAGTVGTSPSFIVGGVFTTAGGTASSRLAKIVRPLSCADTAAPSLVWVQPRPGSSVTTSTPTLRLGAFDNGSAGLDTPTLTVLQGGQVLAMSCNWSADGDAVDCVPPSLGGGAVTLVARIRDRNGNQSADQSISFTITDSTPPTISFAEPTEGATLVGGRPRLRLSYADVGSGVDPSTLAITRDGAPLAVECQTSASEALCAPASPLANGAITLAATVRDVSGNLSAPAVRHATIATLAPATTTVRGMAVLEGGGIAAGAQIWVGGRPGATTTAAADGSFQIASVPADPGSSIDLYGNLSIQLTTYVGFKGAIAPVAGGITEVGELVLRARCDSFMSPLPFVAGGGDAGGGTLGLEPIDIERFAVFDDGNGPRVFAGGDFNYGSAGALPRVARWGSRGWDPVGSGVGHDFQPAVNAFAVFDDGTGPALYAGGYFAKADGQAAGHLARWDGREWQEVGRGVNGEVTGLAVFDDGTGPALYVAGNFTRVQTRKDWTGADVSIAANHVAKWTGSAWSQVGGGRSFSGSNMTFDLSVLRDGGGDGLYLWERGGPGIWKLVSGAWQLIGWTFDDPTVVLLSDVVSATVGGSPAIYATASGLGVQKRVGSSWVEILPADWLFYSLASFSDGSGSFLYASGPFVGMPGAGAEDQLRRWNGTSWSAPLAAAGQLSVLTGFEAQPVLVRPAPFSKWQGNAWVPFPVSIDTTGAINSVAFAPGTTPSILFGGPTSVAGVAIDGGIGRWDGASVTAVTAGLTGGSKVVQSFDGTTTRVYGIAETSGQVAEWNGSGWTLLGSALGVPIHDVDWVDLGDGPRLYAAGNGVYRWNGAFWYGIGGPNNVSSIEGFQSALYAGGAFASAGAVPARNLARWNGTAWSAVGPTPNGVDGAVYALQSFGGFLQVGGAFSNTGSNTPHFAFAAWNGSSWSAGAGPSCGLLASRFSGPIKTGSVRAMTTFDDGTQPRLVTGGDYAAECLSKTGNTFNGRIPGYANVDLGTGVDGPPVMALAAGRWNGTPAVAIGGDFATAGGKPSGKLALWYASPSAGTCAPAAQPPKITITSPAALTNQSSVTLAGRVDEPATLTVDGATVALAGDLTFAVSGVALREGANDFLLEAIDRGGLRGSLNVHVVRDSVAPTLAFVAPAAGSTTFGAAQWLELALADGSSGIDATSLLVSLDGSAVPAAVCVVQPARARCNVTPTAGAHTATATVRDRAGNLSAAAQVSFQADPASLTNTQLTGTVQRLDGTPAAGARVRILGRPGAEGTTQADGSFSFAVAGVTSAAPWSVVAELTEGQTTLVGFRTGLVPVPGGTTAAGIITLHAPCDGTFDPDLLGVVGVSGRVRALATFDDGTGPALYVGGDFLRTEGSTVHHLLVWKGDRIAPLPAAPNGPVHSLAVFDEGSGPKLFVGGAFTSVGGVAVRNLARWSGSAWSDVGGGVESCGVAGGVDALGVFDFGAGPRLYVGGDFISVGAGTAADLVASWDGVAWSGFGPGVACPGGFESARAVFALARYDDGTGPALYAAGEFSRLGGVAAKGIAKRVGSTWAPLSYGLGSIDGGGSTVPSIVTSLSVFDGASGAELYAAGTFNRAGNLTGDVNSIARWDGRRWASVGDGLEVYYLGGDFGTYVRPNGVQSLSVFDDGSGPALYASGSFTDDTETRFGSVARWDGERWGPVGTGISAPSTGGMAMATFGGELYLGGGFATAGDRGVNGIARWNGESWRALGNGFDRAVRALAIHDDGTGPALYVAGEFHSHGDMPLEHVARFGGATWTPLGDGTDGDVLALASHDDGTGAALYAGGTFAAAGGVAASGVARWRAGAWEPLGSGLDATASVAALAAHDDGSGPALYAGGNINQAGGLAVGHLARWRQGTWSAPGNFDAPVKALLSTTLAGAPALVAGGSFGNAGGVAAAGVARLAGGSWAALGAGPGGTVEALAPWQGGKLAAAGSFPGRLSLWDGTQWTAASGGMPNATINALARWDDGSGDALFAGGGFANVGALGAKGVAAWSGASWSALAQGASGGSVLALQGMEDATGPALFLGGSFTGVDGVPAVAFAKWMRPLSCADTRPPAIQVTAPAAGLVKARPPLVATYSDTGSAVDPASLQWTLDGAPLAATCTEQPGSSTCLVDADLPDGAHQLEASVADLAGNRGTASPVSISVDATAPTVSFSAPADGSVLTNASTPISFVWTDSVSGIDLDGFDFFLSGSSSWRVGCTYNLTGGSCVPQIPFGDGRWTARVSITDQAANLGEARIAFTVETQPPAIAVLAPSNGALVNDATPQIRLRMTDAGTGVDVSTLAITINGSPWAGSCQTDVDVTTCLSTTPLAEGLIQLGASVRDRHGRLASISSTFTISLDSTAPVVTVASPADGFLTTDSEVTVTGSVSEPVTLTLNGDAVTVAPGLSFTHGPVPLAEGLNPLRLEARDTVGNLGSATITVRRDTTAPTLVITKPVQGAVVDLRRRPVVVEWTDEGSGVDAASLGFTINGTVQTLTCSGATAGGNSCWFTATPAGPVTLVATVRDHAGNTGSATVAFTSSAGADLVPPQIDLVLPRPGSAVRKAAQVLAGVVSEPATLTLDGQPVPVAANGTFVVPVTLVEGVNSFQLRATDAANNVGALDFTLDLDTLSPASPVDSLVTVVESTPGSFFVVGSSGAITSPQAGDRIVVRSRPLKSDWVFAVAPSGSFSGGILGLPGDQIEIALRDEAGNESTPIARTLAGTTPTPPDPASVAPPGDPTLATDLCASNSFLWTGSQRVQLGVAPGTLDCERLALVRGSVVDRIGLPIAGVRVLVEGHPELGMTMTRANGVYDLALNGGEALTLRFLAAGYLPAARTLHLPWRDWVSAPEVTLVSPDPVTTSIDLAATTPIQVARGSVVVDPDGSRQATVLFPQGTVAEMVLPNGSTQALTSIHVRATEYTVGQAGGGSLPGDLPPDMDAVYAVELSVDEASSAGADHVLFDSPVAFYVDAFVDIPVGESIPAAHLDVRTGVWTPASNGRVVAVLSEAGGSAVLDVDGSGQPASASALEALGVSTAELDALAQLYDPGKRLWRLAIPHFSVWGVGWPRGYALPPIPDPGLPRAGDSHDLDKPSLSAFAGTIEVENQILGQAIPIAGSGAALHYRSDRVHGRKAPYLLSIPLTDPTVPETLQMIEVAINVAGQEIRQSFLPQPSQVFQFAWDGLDRFGRPSTARVPWTVAVTYVYPGSYRQADSGNPAWGKVGGIRYESVPARNEERLTKESTGDLGTIQALTAFGLGGWSLDIHHNLDVAQKTLFFGDGRRRQLGGGDQKAGVLTRIAGTGERGSTGDGADAKLAKLDRPAGLSMMRDGSLLFTEHGSCRVRKIDRAGTISTIAGSTCAELDDPFPEQIPATLARLVMPMKAIEAPDGSIYIAEPLWIRKVSPDGLIETFAGSGKRVCTSGSHGWDGPARYADLANIRDIAFDVEGNLLIANHSGLGFGDPCKAILKVDHDANVSVLVPYVFEYFEPSTVPPGQGSGDVLINLASLATTPDGSVYFSDPDRVLRRPPGGKLSWSPGSRGWKLAGTLHNQLRGGEFAGDGLPAGSETRFNAPAGIDVGRDGTLYIADFFNGRIRAIGPDKIVNTIAGGGQFFSDAEELDGTAAVLGWPDGVVVDPADEELYFTDRATHKIWRLGLPAIKASGASIGELVVPSGDGAQLYVFDLTGRHLRTEDSVTRTALWTFRYQDYPQDGGATARLLTEAEDAFGNILRIERSESDGTPLAIVAPLGQRTRLIVDPTTKMLREVRRSVGLVEEKLVFTTNAEGLLTQVKTPKGQLYDYRYDADGRLIEVDDPENGELRIRLDTAEKGHKVTLTTKEGRVSSTEVTFLDTGEVLQEVIGTNGLKTKLLRKTDGSVEQTAPDGTKLTVQTAPEPRLGASSRMVTSTFLESEDGKYEHFTERARTLTSVGGDPLGLVTQSDFVSTNGRSASTTYTASSRSLVVTSPEGRRQDKVFDTFGRLTNASQPNVLPMELSYDERGRVEEVRQGAGQELRKSTFTYDPEGWLEKVADPLLREARYEHDEVGRMTRVIRPDDEDVHFDYDLNGNVTEITPPGRPAHQFDHNQVDQASSYTAPMIGAPRTTTYDYDDDHRLTTVTRPDGGEVEVTYDAAGRIASVVAPDAQTSYAYDEDGKLVGITGTGGSTIAYEWDGPWLKELEVGGPFSATVQLEPDRPEPGFPVTNFWLGSWQFEDRPETKITIEHEDDDGLPTKIGDLELFYEPAPSGRFLGTHVLNTGTKLTWNSHGELSQLEAGYQTGSSSGTPPFVGSRLLDVTYTRDKLGRITQKTEVTRAAPEASPESRTFDYRYDLAGRLEQVNLGAALVEEYHYDANGNRTSWTTSFGSGSAVYDNQDRLISYGPTQYTYSTNGELRSKSVNGQTVTYTYDALSNLRAVRLADGVQIEYLVDGQNHRTGKKVNGALVQRFVYLGGLSPIAEVDGSGEVTTQYVYAGGNVASYFIRGGAKYRILTDHLGSVRYVLDAATGAVVQRMEYDSFGRVTLDTNPGFQPFGFGGGLYDPQTGLVRFGARDYDAETARWTSKDPIGFNGGDSNVYAYVGGDPVNGVDPSGLQEMADLIQRNDFEEWGAGKISDAELLARGRARGAGALIGAAPHAGMFVEIAAELLPIGAAGLATAGVAAAGDLLTDGATGPVPALRPGSFSIFDWSGYPAGIPRPTGPFRLLVDLEYETARSAANQANRAMHAADPALAGQHIHEIQPVKFGGDPVDPINKIPLAPSAHSPLTTWWNRLQRALEQ